MKVEPAQLISAATSVDTSRIELQIRHDATQAAIEAALVGWVGASAVALRAGMTRWRATDDAVQADLLRHRDALAAAGREFISTDAANSGALDL